MDLNVGSGQPKSIGFGFKNGSSAIHLNFADFGLDNGEYPAVMSPSPTTLKIRKLPPHTLFNLNPERKPRMKIQKTNLRYLIVPLLCLLLPLLAQPSFSPTVSASLSSVGSPIARPSLVA